MINIQTTVLRTLQFLVLFIGLYAAFQLYLLYKMKTVKGQPIEPIVVSPFVPSADKPKVLSALILEKPIIEPITVTSIDSLTESLGESINVTSANIAVESSLNLFEKSSTAEIIKSLEKIINKPPNESIIKPISPIREIMGQYSFGKDSITQSHLASQAELRLQANVTYDGRYLKIGYPMGDVPAHIGVCTDVVIRSFRGLGIDLQQRVHEDMKRSFRSYPNNWSLTKPDPNIDHRRVPNLMTYFKRTGAALRISSNPSDYVEGNIVAWDLGSGLTHIGIVSSHVSHLTGNPLIVHNIGSGPEMNDMLFKHKIIGHYKYGKASIPISRLTSR